MTLKLKSLYNKSTKTFGVQILIPNDLFLNPELGVRSVSTIRIAHESQQIEKVYIELEFQKPIQYEIQKNLLTGSEAYCQGASNPVGEIL